MQYVDKCKCCLEAGRLRSMWNEYVRDGVGTREIYGQMLSECFALSWQQPALEEKICELCVGRLRNAAAFKNQVLETELLLLEHLNDNEDAEDVYDSNKLEYPNHYEVVEYLETEYIKETVQNNVVNIQSILPNNSHKNVRNTSKRKARIEDNKTSNLDEVTMTGSAISARNGVTKKLKTETDNEGAEDVYDSNKLEYSNDYEDVEYLETEYIEETVQNNVVNIQSILPNNSNTNVRNTSKRKARIEDNKTSELDKVPMTDSDVSARNRLTKKLKTETDNEGAEDVYDSNKLEYSNDYEDVEYLETEYIEETVQNNVVNIQSILPNNSHTNVRNTSKRKVRIEDNKTSNLDEVTMTGSAVSARSGVTKKLKTETGTLLVGDTTISKIQSQVLPGGIEEYAKPAKTKLITNTSENADLEYIFDYDQEIQTIELEIQETKEDTVIHPLYKKYLERGKHQDNLRIILLCTNATPIRKRSDAGYLCGFCSKAFHEPANLKQHSIEDHDKATKAKYMKEVPMFSFCVKLDITSLHCNLCGSEIDTVEQLLEHLKFDHGKTVHTDIKNHLIPYKFNSDALKCFMCGQEFKYFKILTHHMSSHYKNFRCDSCDIYFVNKGGLKCHYRTHASGVFPCKYCPKVFDAKKKRTNHERIVHTLGRYNITCGLCGKKFKLITTKEKHLEDYHGIARKPLYKCYTCEKSFFCRRSLKRHTDRFHLSLKNYKCAECSKEFFDKRTFAAHMVSHTGVKEYKCEVCFRLFSHKRTLDLHLRIHFNDRRFNCEYCGKAFIQKCSLVRHLNSIHDDIM